MFLFVVKIAVSLFGRLVIAESGGLALQVGLSLIVAAIELLSRLSLIAREEMLIRVCGCCTQRERRRQREAEAGHGDSQARLASNKSILEVPSIRRYLSDVVAVDMVSGPLSCLGAVVCVCDCMVVDMVATTARGIRWVGRNGGCVERRWGWECGARLGRGSGCAAFCDQSQ